MRRRLRAIPFLPLLFILSLTGGGHFCCCFAPASINSRDGSWKGLVSTGSSYPRLPSSSAPSLVDDSLFSLGVSGHPSYGRTDSKLFGNKFNEELEEAAYRRAQEARAKGGGVAETAAGAILGGLVLGPFGALFGAQLGANIGSSRSLDRARKDEMARMGITPDMLRMAEESGVALERAMEGLKATRNSLETQQSFARRLDADAKRLYEQAQAALAASDEDRARKFLMERQQVQQRLKKALLACADEKRRLERMEQNIQKIEERAIEIEALLRRSVGAKALQDTSVSDQLSLSREDPLLQKFKDMGID